MQWPEDVLGCPLRASYRVEADPMFKRTEVEDGPPRYRRVRHRQRKVVTLTFLWVNDQLRRFEAWVETNLGGGVAFFYMKQLDGGEWRLMRCHLLEGYTIQPSRDMIGRVEVSFTVEAYAASNVIDAGQVLAPAPTSDVIDANVAASPSPGGPIDAGSAANPAQP
jgi:hypothetical protein